MKKPIQHIVLVCTTLFFSCTSNGATTNITNSADSTNNQAIVDSIYEATLIPYNNIFSAANKLNGRVQGIRIDSPEGHDIFSFPVKNMQFDKEGRLEWWNQYFGSASSNNIKIDETNGVVTIKGIMDLSTSVYERHSAKVSTSNNSIIFEFENSFGREPDKERFEFLYNGEGKLQKVRKHISVIDDYEGLDERIENDYDYSVSINNEDEFGNWTSITLKSKEESITYTREIFYYTDEKPIALSIESKEKVYYTVPSEAEGEYIRYYDRTTNKVVPLLPPEYSDEMLGYVDFRIIGDSIYLIYATGNSGAMAYNCVEAVYSYNYVTEEWNEIGCCAEGCEFNGNRIKMPIYDDEADKMTYTFYEIK